MTLIQFAFGDPTAGGVDAPAAGLITCSLVVAEHLADRTRTTSRFTTELVGGSAVVELSPTGPGQAWRISCSWLDGLDTFYKAVPDSPTPIGYQTLVDLDPATLTPSTQGQAAWDRTRSEVAELIAGIEGSSTYIDPDDPLVLVVAPGAAPDLAPSVTAQPVGASVVAGSSATFTVSVAGRPTPTIQWQLNSVDIPGATSSTLTITGTTVADSGKTYRAKVTNTAGVAYSDAALLTVTAAPVAPAIVTQPQSATVYAGLSATFTAAASGSPAPTVKWQTSSDGTNWTDIPGAATTALTITPQLADNGKRYRAVFSNTGGTATTTSATLTVNAPVAPVVTSATTAQASADGYPVTHTVTATGSPAPTYQWQRADWKLGDGTPTNIPGATSASYTTPPLTNAADDGNTYMCVVSNVAGSVTSNPASVDIPANGSTYKLRCPNGWVGASGSVTVEINKPVSGTAVVSLTARAINQISGAFTDVTTGVTVTTVGGQVRLTWAIGAQAVGTFVYLQAKITDGSTVTSTSQRVNAQ